MWWIPKLHLGFERWRSPPVAPSVVFILLTGVWVCVIFSFFLFTYELCTEAEFI